MTIACDNHRHSLAMLGQRRRSTYFILLLVLAVGLVLIHRNASELTTYLPEKLYPGQRNESTVTLNEDLESPPPEHVSEEIDDPNRLCKPDECMDGSWKPREPPFRDFADFKRKYPPNYRNVFKVCGSEENKREPEDRNKYHEAQGERLVHVMNWVWKPKQGRMREWDPIEFVVRLLKSPGGLIITGDSISRQHFNWLQYALARADILTVEERKHPTLDTHNRVHQFTLRPGDSMTAYLQDRAGVPNSRLERPIYTKIDSHILLGEKSFREFSVPLGAKADFLWPKHLEHFEGWEEFVQEAARTRGEYGVSEDTILILNTGSHWSRGSLYMFPNTGDAAEQQSRVTDMFKKMIQTIISRLDPIPNLSIYYRGTSPGHPACTSASFYKSFGLNSSIISQPDDNENSKRFVDVKSFFTSPYPDAIAAQQAMSNITESVLASTPDQHQKVVQSRWDYDRFEAHNAEWKQAIASIRQASGPTLDKDKAKWYYMDIWDMSLQRADAHTQNLDMTHGRYDCLHWCVPGVLEQWMEYLNHLVFWDDRSYPD